MSRMTEEERQKTEALLRQCRRQTSEIEHDQRDWEERNEAIQAEKEWQQQKSGQQASPELGRTSGGKVPTGTLKVKSSKGRTVEVVQVGTSEQAEEKPHSMSSEARDESAEKDESAQQKEHYETKSDNLLIEFEDPVYEFMQEAEIKEEYTEITPEQEEELASQLTPHKRAEYREMKEFYRIQANGSGQGMELWSAVIKSRAKWHASGLPPDLIQWIVKVEPDASKQDIGQISEVQQQTILQKCEGAPRTMRPGTNKGYYVYIENEGGVYVETVDEKGVPTLVLDTETDKQLTTDLITEEGTDKYFT